MHGLLSMSRLCRTKMSCHRHQGSRAGWGVGAVVRWCGGEAVLEHAGRCWRVTRLSQLGCAKMARGLGTWRSDRGNVEVQVRALFTCDMYVYVCVYMYILEKRQG